MPKTWIFDLDNTLHDAEPYIFPEMNRLMNDYVSQHLGIGVDEADALRLHYWQRYGTTLSGLLHHHDHIDPEHFLAETHRFADLPRQLRPMRGLRATLARLPGRKILFTNAPLAYAVTVLRGLGVAYRFDGVIAIQQTRLRPKPDLAGYRRLLQRYRLDPRRCVMVEDSRGNLAPARRLGMATVWLARRARRGPVVDVALHRLDALPAIAGRRGWLHNK
ncbi:pyrimidine 5'-nucleotidase [Chitinimonas koreensis]|uniref:pyrimidine 5'-nucleotidase n=1 Tax=Chitinimonas koreensis TaxID=356302 RepID=UPI00040A1E04|nr:pyrimidine 5'-nucleotidase [Chitinimonas koreensis]QNM97136.1 pyrimidine 5'-nucleotidase [Chitinimonas koreensis]